MVMPDIVRTDEIGEILCDAELITRDELNQARALAEDSVPPQALLDVLVRTGALSESQRAELVELEQATPYIDLKHCLLDPDVVSLLPRQFAVDHKAIAIDRADSVLTLAMADPLSLGTIDDAQRITGLRIREVAASPESIEYAIMGFYGDESGEKDMLASLLALTFPDQDDPDESRLRKLVEERPVVATVNRLLIQAIRSGASDIHMCPGETQIAIRNRIDGVLRDVEFLPADVLPALVSRIKVLAKLDIAEKRLPQDGRIEVALGRSSFDLRISIVPSYHGENVVIRLLSREGALDLSQLGLGEADLELVKRFLAQPHGIIIVTGPTGSGKTATLHAALASINSRDINITTIEDPVEYLLPGASQIQVQTSVGLTFARILRSVLRQDPDVIMVGEIRDEETAELAIRAALTGHLVLATTHTNDAVGAVTRLRNLDVPSHLLASCLRGIIAQRLLRTICPSCRESYEPPNSQIELIGGLPPGQTTLVRGTGCDRCQGTGYDGRTAAFEMLPVDAEIAELIERDAPEHELRAATGRPSLREVAVGKALAGITTADEVRRTLGVSLRADE